MILAGDVGATQTRLAIFEPENNGLRQHKLEIFPSRDYKNLSDIINKFLNGEQASISCAAIGVAGPVQAAISQITNLPWTVSEEEIKKSCSLKKFILVNDLLATAYGIPYLNKSQITEIYPGEKKKKETAIFSVIAVGTGLGQAFLSLEKDKIRVFPSEGGHGNFAASNSLELELAEYLYKKSNYVSVEDILSGPGSINIYNFFKDCKQEKEPEELATAALEEKALLITKFAKEEKYEICIKTTRLFLQILGAHAANLALTTFSSGGVYLAGGISHKTIDQKNKTILINSFLEKGKLSYLIKEIPIYLIKEELCGLIGAAHLAKESA